MLGDIALNLIALTIVIGTIVGTLYALRALVRLIIKETRILSRYLRRASLKSMGYIVMKFKKSVVADALYDVILTLAANGVLSHRDHQHVCEEIAKALDIPELLPRDVMQIYCLAKLKAKNGGLRGPVRKIPGSEDWNKPYVPIPETNVISQSEFLNRLREKQTA